MRNAFVAPRIMLSLDLVILRHRQYKVASASPCEVVVALRLIDEAIMLFASNLTWSPPPTRLQRVRPLVHGNHQLHPPHAPTLRVRLVRSWKGENGISAIEDCLSL